jgi:hypothetical protein
MIDELEAIAGLPKAMQQEIVVSEDGSVEKKTPLVNWSESTEPLHASKLSQIREKISDPEFDPAEISRWIALEIAVVAENMMATNNANFTTLDNTRLKIYSESIKALRELGKQLNDTEVLNKKDVLNFDGRKFEFVLGAIIDLFKQAMKEAGMTEDQRTSVMKHYRDLMSTNEVTIRRDTQKLDSKK